jgi:hypothetical protein
MTASGQSGYRYVGLEVVQQPGAQPFYLLGATAGELLEWCDVPRTRGDYMAGYQRILDSNRISSIAEYFRKSANNLVPGAILIAVDVDHVRTSRMDTHGAWVIEILPDERDFDTKLAELWGAFTTRLGEEELASAGIEYLPGSVRGEQSPTEVEYDGDSLNDEDESLYPSSYLALLAQELGEAMGNWGGLTAERQKAIREFIDGTSKPGLIIDGQHRVFGAKGVSEHDVTMPVVLIPGLDHSEQVFQFYVLNSKARPLTPSELRRIVSTSLTNAEIQALYDRFRQAGVDADEARWTYELNTRPDSPFLGRIDFGFGEPGAVIKENVADQLLRSFMKMSKSRYRSLTQPLGKRWQDPELRLEIFFWLWNAVKNEYADAWATAEAMAEEGKQAQLFMKVALLTLQKFLLDHFVTGLPYRDDGADPPLSSQSEVRGMVASTLQNLPSGFFTREWKIKQIDTTDGRKQLYGWMEDAWNNQGKYYGNLKLFQG